MQRSALTLALALIAAPALGQDGAEARLEAAKNAMVDHALSQPTRVHSAAWVDENGVLHEQSRYQSQGRIRGIRLPSYLPKPQDQNPEATPASSVLAESTESVKEDALPQEDSCALIPGLTQVAVLDVQGLTPAGNSAAGYARQLENETRRLLLRRFEGADRWRLAPRHESASLRSDYERAVYEGPRNRRPLQLTIALAVRQSEQKPRWWNLSDKALAPLRENFGPFRRHTQALELDLELRPHPGARGGSAQFISGAQRGAVWKSVRLRNPAYKIV